MKYGLFRKGLVIGIIVLFIGAGVISSMGLPFLEKKFDYQILNGNTLYVGGSGPGNYTKIQDAIDDANERDTIFVYAYSSPYYERVDIYKSIKLIGEDRNTTVIDGDYYGNVLKITADSVTVCGFTIQHSGNKPLDTGIEICSNNNNIIGNIIRYNLHGVYLIYHTENNNIANNILFHNTRCLYLVMSYNNIITGNNINSYYHYGINLYDDSNNNIINCNNISKNDYGIEIQGSKHNTIENNQISSNNIGITLLPCIEGWGGTILGSIKNCILKNNFINNKQDATFLYSYEDDIDNILHLNRWSQNYWERPRILPKLIFGKMIIIPWINIDWRPALRPYNI